MAKKAKAAADDETAVDGDTADAAADGGDEKSKKAKKTKRPRSLGPKTVAKPCLVGAVVLTLLGAVLPR